MEARNRLLPDWFTRVRTRQIKLPRFQRHEAWTHDQVTALLNNVLWELPAGSVLILEVGDEEKFISRPVVGAPNEGERVTEHLLDGQQRLTALWRSLTNDYDDRTYVVKLEQDEETAAPYYAISYARHYRNEKRYPVWLDDPQQLWGRHFLPIHLLRPDPEAEQELEEWATQASEGDTKEVLRIVKAANRLRQQFAKFNLPFLALPSTVSQETALNVFIQMNTSASPLTAYDIVVAQVEAVSGQSLHDLVEELNHDVPAVQAYANSSDLMLAVSSLLQDKVPNKSTYLTSEFSNEVVENWDRVKVGIERATRFLEQEGIFDVKRLPSDVTLYPLSALWAMAPEGLDAEGEARTLLRKYLWRSFFTDRYERTSATRSLVDYRQLSVLLDGSSDEEPKIFDDEEHPLPAIEELIAAGWPVRKDRMARTLLALALRSGGLDFADATPASRVHLPRREYHHLFPRAYLEEQGIATREIDRVLNCALVSWKTNRNISAKTPSTYLMERIDGSSLGEAEVGRRLESHLIPIDEFMANDYSSFLTARAEQTHSLMQRLCNGEAV
jgi:hypothetical protein